MEIRRPWRNLPRSKSNDVIRTVDDVIYLPCVCVSTNQMIPLKFWSTTKLWARCVLFLLQIIGSFVALQLSPPPSPRATGGSYECGISKEGVAILLSWSHLHLVRSKNRSGLLCSGDATKLFHSTPVGRSRLFYSWQQHRHWEIKACFCCHATTELSYRSCYFVHAPPPSSWSTVYVHACDTYSHSMLLNLHLTEQAKTPTLKYKYEHIK